MTEMLLASAAASGSNMLFIAYGGFILLVIAFLALDLGVFHKEAHAVTMKEAATWSVVWVTLGLLFSVLIYFAYDNQWLGLGAETRKYNPAAAHTSITPPSRQMTAIGRMTSRYLPRENGSRRKSPARPRGRPQSYPGYNDCAGL